MYEMHGGEGVGNGRGGTTEQNTRVPRGAVAKDGAGVAFREGERGCRCSGTQVNERQLVSHLVAVVSDGVHVAQAELARPVVPPALDLPPGENGARVAKTAHNGLTNLSLPSPEVHLHTLHTLETLRYITVHYGGVKRKRGGSGRVVQGGGAGGVRVQKRLHGFDGEAAAAGKATCKAKPRERDRMCTSHPIHTKIDNL